ncbi:MAG: CHAT domain-containing protein [Oscillospiraceae bacterium]
METTRLAQLLARYRIPCMVLNACQSGMMDGQARDPFACVAAGLLRAGVYSVVAMGYSLYVSAAKEFVPAFYRKLFEKGSVSEAVRAGREEMYRQPQRSCVTGKLPLQDWVFRCCTGRCRRAMPASPASSRIARGRKGDRLCPRRRIWGTTASLGATGSFSSWSGPCSASPRRPS